MTRRRGIVGALLAVVALLGILVLSNPRDDPYDRPFLDPRGTGPDGTAALVALLRAEGAVVVVGGLPTGSDDVTLMLQDTLSGRATDQLAGWASDGGTLVVADPFAAPVADALGDDTVFGLATDRPRVCTLDALADVQRVAPSLDAVYEVGPGTSCFGDDRVAGVVARGRGDGIVVALSSPEVFVNERLGTADNAVLAAALLVPAVGARVRVLDPHELISDEEDVGDGTVLGALPLRGSQAVTQLVIAFLACGLILGRRLGRPVTEELPVPLPASDLVLASGLLLDRNGDVGDAADRLRRRTRRDLGPILGLGADPPPHQLADALRIRAGLDSALVDAALLAPVVDEDGLVRVAAQLDRLRRELSP